MNAKNTPLLIDDVIKKFGEPLDFSKNGQDSQDFSSPLFKSRQKKDRSSWQRSAVLIGIIEKSGVPNLVLTKRTEKLHKHSGQIAFPGGKREAHDKSDEETAIREAYEEIGLKPDDFTKLGELQFHYTGTGFEIRPIVGLIKESAQFTKNDNEVDEIFTVPLSFVLDPKNYVIFSKSFGTEKLSFYAISYKNYYIWGATAAMIRSLSERLSR
ncbi:CoA pyrophosphatase [Bartonella apihabitans]|uniref:CoA pyrophosphatase n=1 Tax=uncultured Bartonella sp. TaxID=104108 RepID=UPI0025D0FA64|nr:CoA pyrophosphatase [Bartonella apihabitans]WLT07971.1 CoA pyrophosphatase [Bartonella apihabitans]